MSAVNESKGKAPVKTRLQQLTLARSTVDRASELRTDPDKLAALWQSSKILVVVGDRIRASDQELIFHSAAELPENIGERYFLGIDRTEGSTYFAFHLGLTEAADPNLIPQALIAEEELRSLRQIGAQLSDIEAGLAVHAVALGNWHSAHPHCPKCGAETRVELGGAVRICVVDASQHHPRTDPAVIVLVKDENDRILLGHQPVWPAKRFSNFAGFVEPGESFEQCVVREVAEESGVIVHSIEYLGSQPWPFPASIMIAYEATTSDISTAKPDGEEITEIRWFSRSDMKSAVQSEEVLLPPQISVARKMIEYWYGAGAEIDLNPPASCNE